MSNSNPVSSASQAAIPTAGQVLEKLFTTTHRLHLLFEARLAEYGLPAFITGPRLRFLVTVAEAGTIRMGDMAVRSGIAPRTVTQFADALEQERLLLRLPDPEDRRSTLLRLTDKALPLMDRARSAMKESAEQVLGHLEPDKREQFHALLLLLGAAPAADAE
ncbi:MarR family winged helix-turn-helix transcriptional regulator [Paenibacillus sacheonensis]|uniref:MarR family transcriptional regulator n=1 Tax=Paenibacillus sacheonensis TaxID=742054 RepID=A0A7X5BZS3_9BACL|nr:MarR family transcriptional regulator [Paenibacillus sacheonensis]MBM7563976.1 DNA-binding MarR family transcriptional regulator [Paenibacillus sacheonensis]NBC67684.1 MarR family transcriptional regulator [Paenibacillus sacheonensis]